MERRPVTDEELAALVAPKEVVREYLPTEVSRSSLGRDIEVGTTSPTNRKVGTTYGGKEGVPTSSGGKTAPKYPWELWTNGAYHEATYLTDYFIYRGQFVTLLHNYANRKGLFVATRQINDDKCGFQFCQSRLERSRLRANWEGVRRPPEGEDRFDVTNRSTFGQWEFAEDETDGAA